MYKAVCLYKEAETIQILKELQEARGMGELNNVAERSYMGEGAYIFKDHRLFLKQRISSHENSRLSRRVQPSSRS